MLTSLLRSASHFSFLRTLSCSSTPLRFHSNDLKLTPLHDIHVRLGAKLGDFAGYDMPFTYPDLSSVESHIHTRKKASLFDVSHMLRLRVDGSDSTEFLEKLFVADLSNLQEGKAAYTLLMNDQGGITDDAIVAKCDGYYYIVLNAGCAEKDLAHLNRYHSEMTNSGKQIGLEVQGGALVALQGPSAESVLRSICDNSSALDSMYFMDTIESVSIGGTECRVTRCGYTGEDGFEVEIKNNIEGVVDKMLNHSEVAPAGLVTRDTLRLEAGLALYGNDLLDHISPVQASLVWTISKRRKKNPTFLGAERFQQEVADGVSEKRIGLIATGSGRIIRPGTELLLPDTNETVGKVCSGGFSPCLSKSIAMAYVQAPYFKQIKEFDAVVGKSKQRMNVTSMPFVPTKYKMPPKK